VSRGSTDFQSFGNEERKRVGGFIRRNNRWESTIVSGRRECGLGANDFRLGGRVEGGEWRCWEEKLVTSGGDPEGGKSVGKAGTVRVGRKCVGRIGHQPKLDGRVPSPQ